jgi:CRP-like cAMP-binding protein
MELKICQNCSNNICARKVSIFSSLNDQDIEKIVKMTGHKNYKKGDFLSKFDMDNLLSAHPEINQKILQEVSKRLIQTENLVQNLSTNDTNSKVAYVLLELAERYGIEKKNQIHIEMPINREEMANYAGVTRETMSRKLSNFEKSGIIRAEGNKIILINDKNALLDLI